MPVCDTPHQNVVWEQHIPFLKKFISGQKEGEKARLQELRNQAYQIVKAASLKVTVIMPVWNRAHTVIHALESVFAQNYSAYEVLVCDDGSQDKTVEVIHEAFPEKIESGELKIL